VGKHASKHVLYIGKVSKIAQFSAFSVTWKKPSEYRQKTFFKITIKEIFCAYPTRFNIRVTLQFIHRSYLVGYHFHPESSAIIFAQIKPF